MNTFLTTLGILIAVILAAAFVVPGFVDWNQFRGAIAAQVEEATGREFVIGGDMKFSILPAPAITMHEVTLANFDGAAEPHALQLARLDAQVALAPLFRGAISVSKVRLVRPTMVIEFGEGGASSWDFLFGRAQAFGEGPGLRGRVDEEEATPAETDEDGLLDLGRISFDSVVIEKGTVHYRSPLTGDVLAFDNVNTEVSAGSLFGPFKARGDAVYDAFPFSFAAAVGVLTSGKAFPVTAEISSGDDGPRLTLNGIGTEALGRSRFDGTVLAQIPDLSGLAERYFNVRPAGLKDRMFRAEGGVIADRKQIEFRALKLSLDDLLFKANGTIGIGDKPGFSFLVGADSLNLDTFLAAGEAAREAAREAEGGSWAGFRLPDLPPELSGSVGLGIEGIIYRDGLIRGLNSALDVGNGTIAITDFTAELPGRTALAFSGNYSKDRDGPRFDGSVEAEAEQPLLLADWLGVPEAGRLVKRSAATQFDAKIALSEKLYRLYGGRLKTPSFELTGGLSYAMRERPSLAVDLDLDRLNLDRLLTPAAGEVRSFRDFLQAYGLDALDSYDANVKLAIETANYGDLTYRDGKAEIVLLNGELAVPAAAVGDAAGARITLDGEIAGLDDDPAGRVGFTIKGDDLAGVLVPLAGGESERLRLAGRAMGPADVSGDITFEDQAAVVLIKGGLGRTQGEVSGRVRDYVKGAALADYDLKLKATSASLTQLARQAGLGAYLTGEVPASLEAAFRGTFDRLAIDLTSDLDALVLGIGGDITDVLGDMAFDVTLTAVGERSGPALGLFGLALPGDALDERTLAVTAGLSGNSTAFDIRDLQVSFDESQLGATLALSLAEPRPLLSGEIKAGNGALADFLGTGLVAAADAGGVSGWSTEPIDLAASWRLALDVRARNYDVYGLLFDEVDAQVSLDDNGLLIDDIDGVAFGGDLEGRLAYGARGDLAGGMPQVTLQMSGDGIDAARATDFWYGAPTLGGEGRFAATLSGEGRSLLTLVSSLGGTAEISVDEGAFEGFDLAALATAADSAPTMDAFAASSEAALSAGATPFEGLNGTFTAEGGILRSTGFEVQMDETPVAGQAFVDLGRRALDVEVALPLSGFANEPAVTLTVAGPLGGPERRINTLAIQEFVAERLLAAEVERVSGGNQGLLQEILEESGAAPDDATGSVLAPDIPLPRPKPAVPAGAIN